MRRFIVLLASVAAFAQEPISPEERRTMLQQFEREKTVLDSEIEKKPDNPAALSGRGDVRLFLGDAKGAVADFEKEIALEPSHDAPHWRLGIAYYFAGNFEKSAAQFAKYHNHDNRDRENGIWHFLANARVKGIEAARKEMLEYTRFDREPFPSLYEMFAGKKTGVEVLQEAEQKGLKETPLVMFFAQYYVGLNEQLLGRSDEARKHLSRAVSLAREAGAQGGPGYMGIVARLHYDAAAKPQPADASAPKK